jgi:hypothetical protein
MGFASHYLQKHTEQKSLIKTLPDSYLKIVISIPCYSEDKLFDSLESLYNCHRPKCGTEVIIFINYPDNSSKEIIEIHRALYNTVQNWISGHQSQGLFFFVFLSELPSKTAGIGLARKIAMDEAVRRFELIDKPDGIIAGFDADCTCDDNYLVELERFFNYNPKTNGCSIRFEHPVSGSIYPKEVYESIILYELYLRYYIYGLRFATLPYAFHTLGSSFAVKASAYTYQGGMNKRKAGEDFYFLNKIMALGNYHEINTTCIIPSPRPSNRLPFGTGAAIYKLMHNQNPEYFTYCPQAFYDLKFFISEIQNFFKASPVVISAYVEKLPEPIRLFLQNNNFKAVLDEINANCTTLNSFKKRFFRWFNGLMVLHFLNVSHEVFYKKIPLIKASKELIYFIDGLNVPEEKLALLNSYRNLQKKEWINCQPQ